MTLGSSLVGPGFADPKRIQSLTGHSTIQMTFDTYGHLFQDADADQKAAEDIQIRLLGS